MERREALERYIAFLEGLTPEGLDRLGEVCAPGVRFRDPFNEVEGLERYRQVLQRMYEDVPAITFRVSASAVGEELCFLRWQFSGTTSGGRPLEIEGVSEVAFDAEGLVTLHRDFWDAGQVLYEKLPLIGALLRAIRRKLSID
jgi:steroid delta-isomerase